MSDIPSWLADLRDSLRPTFEAGSVACTDLHMLIGDREHGYIRSICLDPRFDIRTAYETERWFDIWGVLGWPNGASLHLFGKKASVERFMKAAHDAGALLPKEHDPGRTPEHYMAAWIHFLVYHLRPHPSNALLPAEPENKRDDAAGWRDCDQLMVNPFTASLTAINAALRWAKADQDKGPLAATHKPDGEVATPPPDTLVSADYAEPVDITGKAAVAENDMATLAAIIGGDTAAMIYARARDESKSVDQRQRQIYALDKGAVGWDGKRWALLLQVTEQAARKTDWWKKDRPGLRGRD